MAPHVTAGYAGLLALGYVLLSVRVIRSRRRAKVPLGGGDHPPLERAMRAHGNFAEYVPLALILLMLAELGGAAAWLLHAAGLALLAGRIIHAYGVSQIEEDYRFRVAGMALTLTALGLAAVLSLAVALS